MKKKLLEIYNEYKKDFLKYLKKVKRQIEKYPYKIKDNLLNKKNRKKYLTTTGLLIIFNLLLINLYISYGYYYDTATLSLLKAVVGDMLTNEHDYVLLVYLENIDSNGNGSGDYRLTSSIPTIGYNYSGYSCQNNSSLIFDEETDSASVTTIGKEVCSIYFDVIGSVDLSVTVMIENDVGSNEYEISESIPAYGYKYSHYECSNNGILEYNSELHKVKLSSSGSDYCKIYFTKENTDINVYLHIEKTYLSGNYIKMSTIPTNELYVLNESKSSCYNNNNERIDTAITYENGYINIGVAEVATCNIYLDKNEE